MQLTEAQRSEALAILRRRMPGAAYIVFGSRAKGGAREYSDLDLAVKGTERIGNLEMFHLREDFSESALPFRVDLVDYRAASEDFRRALDETGAELR